MKVVIVGGVAGGATAAARLRRLNENAEIIMIERSGYVSYANCGLPYYIGGTITDRSKLTLQTPESFRNRFDIDARVRQEVVSIDRTARTVTVRRLDDGTEYVESYDKLILSPGARPVTPELPGIDAERLFALRTVEDTYRIAEFIERERPRRAAPWSWAPVSSGLRWPRTCATAGSTSRSSSAASTSCPSSMPTWPRCSTTTCVRTESTCCSRRM